MPICIGLPCAISLCEADRPVGLTVTGVMSTYSSLAVLATWLITRRENLDWLTPLLTPAHAADCLTRGYKVENNRE